MSRTMGALLTVLAMTFSADAQEIGFAEDFALTKDRAKALQSLIPGTEDYLFYHCLHALNTEQFDKAKTYFTPWLEAFGETPRYKELRLRHALLTYGRDPEGTLAHIRQLYGLRFDHQREITGGSPNLPTALDPKLIARDTLRARAFAQRNLLNPFEDAALDGLATEPFADHNLRRNYLQRLARPDVPNLAKLVADDLAAANSGGFGSIPVHAMMTQAQLEELLRLRPELKDQGNYVTTRLQKLHPGHDDDWRRDPSLTEAYLERLMTYVRSLAPAHNALKAHVLYHRLAFDRTKGTYDRARFLEYLSLPRMQPYMAQRLLEGPVVSYPADLNAELSPQTLMPPVRSDEPLVRAYLKHFFRGDDSPQPFEPFVNDTYLKHLFAEAKIEAGLGEPERWAADLPPELYARLRDRVDIDFAATNKTHFGAGERVALDLHVKNVPTLIVKVFEINTVNYFRENKREIETDVNLDGLVANSEQTVAYAEPPVRRTDRRFEFPQLTKPGVYVVDFIGGGKSSRALIRKGKLRPLVSTGSAGQVIRVVNDANEPVPTATVWLGGKEYAPEKDGSILIPFSSSPGRQPIVLRDGDFASLDYLAHESEAYALTAGIHVEREALLAQRLTTVAIRPGVTLNGKPVSVTLLEEPRLTITAIDLDGVATNSDIPNVRVFEDRETTHEFRVPARLASLTVTLRAKVKAMNSGAKIDLAASQSFTVNGIARTEKIEDLHLAKFGPDYAVELLGRTGEAKADRPIQFTFKHREYRDVVHVTLKTDERGRVNLGPLAGITTITATGPEGTAHSWTLPLDRATYRQVIHAKAGEVIALPYVGTVGEATRAEFALFHVVGTTIRDDRFDALAIKDNRIELKGLAAGDYDLWLKATGEKVRVRVVEGPVVAGHVMGTIRHLEVAPLKPVQFKSIVADADTVKITLQDASAFARVHVFASRYVPSQTAFSHLAVVRAAELRGVMPGSSESAYLTGRDIGDEYRYVLDRRLQKKYPGNMLDRPQLLLNPWAVRVTEAGEQLAREGEAFGTTGAPKSAAEVATPTMPPLEQNKVSMPVDPSAFADLDFMAEAAAVILNLVPDKDGVISVPRKALGSKSIVTVVAVDPLHTVVKSITLPEAPAGALDLRLRAGLDPKGHFTQQKTVSVLAAGKPFTLKDAAGSRFEAYDSLAKLHALYATLSKDPRMAEFAFLLNWPKLKQEEKQTLYSKHACHELSFFLAKKDPAFFNAVVKPYLANKKDKTFLDHYLLGHDLGAYVSPWKYQRLNTVERVLLGQRLPDEAAKTARFLNDLLKLQPPNLDREQTLFEYAVKGSDLAKEQLIADTAARGEWAAKNQPLGQIGGALGGGGGFSGGTGGQFGAGGPPPGPAGMAAPGGPGGPGYKVVLGRAAKSAEDFRARGGEAKGDAKKEDLAKQLRDDLKPGDADGGAKDKLFFGEDRKEKQVAMLYRKVDPTSEWAENNYDRLPIQSQLAGLVGVNPFWAEYAAFKGDGPFLSSHLPKAATNFTEAMFALAVTDLPFEAGKAEVKFDAGAMTYTPAGPTVAFHEEVKPVAVAAAKLPILVSQNFYRHGDRYRTEDGEKLDKFVTDEFVVHTVYGVQIVVTNPSPSRQKLSVLVQIPVGSLPLANARPTKTVLLDLEPYRTGTVDVLFYFPKAGTFAQFPAHVAKNEQLVASAAPFTFTVVDKATKRDTTSWDYVSQNGTDDEVLAFLNRENVHALNLERIAFRMADAKFFALTIATLQTRHAYHQTLASYGLKHNVAAVAEQFLRHAGPGVGGPLASPLYTYDPVERYEYEHLEYKPLVNARAHALGKRRQIVNGRVSEQYHRLLHQLAYRSTLTDDERLAVTHYLILQDRIDEAAASFATVSVDRVATKLQYDACAAYLAVSEGDFAKARAVAMKHANHPVDRWKNTFKAVVATLDEAEGKSPAIIDAENRAQQQARAAGKDPSFGVTVEGQAVNLTWANLSEVTVNYYLMDVELLFSRNPFVQQTGGQFATIRPNATKVVKLDAGQSKSSIPLPEEFVKRNVLVEVSAAGQTKSVPYYANAMDVKVVEAFGQIKVTNAATGTPLSKVYVKAYLRTADGQVKFHKDGYTDVRGRFDYATVSTPEKAAPVRYSVLVLSEEFGAAIREMAPPQQ